MSTDSQQDSRRDIDLTAPTPLSQTSSSPTGGSFWSRNKTLINFWLDAVLLLLFLLQAWIVAVLFIVFPQNASNVTVLGRSLYDWIGALFTVFCVFSVAIVLHVMFHWSWICGVVITKLLHKKSTKDDGSQTLVGVGFLIGLLHIVGAGVLWAKYSLTTGR